MKAVVLKKSALLGALNLLILFLAAGVICARGVYKACITCSKDYPIYSVETQAKKVCITFDAAWESDDTETLIEILKKHNAKATFFAVAEWAAQNEADVVRLKNAGHEIENHSYDHKIYTDLSAAQLCDDIAAAQELIAGITGENPQLVRTPGGEYDKRVIKTIYSLGLYPIQWDVDSLDYTGLSAKEIADRVLPEVKNGSIILFHNGVKNTPEALEMILGELGSRGYEFVKVSDLIYKDDFTFDHTGRQFSNKQS